MILACSWNVLKAQDTDEAFETIRFGIGGLTAFHSVHLDSWTSGYGGSVSASTPFYFGEIQLGMAAQPWRSNDPNLPDFISALVFAGWFVSTTPENAVKASAGVRLGNYFMAFDSPQISGERNESEFAVTPFLNVRRTFFKKIEGFVEVSASRVFTSSRLEMASVSTGLMITFDSPVWLTSILK
ncbi:MAG: hypothetical protein O3B41_10300 [Bacteroidetes bacterium]|nr:hypothetical protein [Bacteroidota bacterium]